jgi:23S rRNA pseudouridine955/2504/2580 synthase
MLLLSYIVKNLEVLYEDDSVIIVNKPAGLAVQGGKGVKSSLDNILAEIRSPPPLLIHRLDKDTSGVLLVAKHKESAAMYSRLLGSSSVKQYIAVCAGHPVKKEDIIKHAIPIHGRMKKSETRYKVIKTGKFDCGEIYSILEIELGSGRMHQIRRHLAMIENPILGDDKYGNFALNKKLRKSAGLKRLLLHASRLIIKKENQLDITAPLPQYFPCH